MSFPETARLELPILQELQATGGSDQVRYLHERLVRYFPQLVPDELEKGSPARARWLRLVQRAGRNLTDRGEVRRQHALWELTQKGRHRIAEEAEHLMPDPPPLTAPAPRTLTHEEAQRMLVEIGQMLGRDAEMEFEHYDVVWRDAPSAPRLSHVFEVQIAGSVDSALTRLMQAYEAQRSRPFLVVADERARAFAHKRLVASFHGLRGVLTFIGVGDLMRLHHALGPHRDLLCTIAARDVKT